MHQIPLSPTTSRSGWESEPRRINRWLWSVGPWTDIAWYAESATFGIEHTYRQEFVEIQHIECVSKDINFFNNNPKLCDFHIKVKKWDLNAHILVNDQS